tara:strand:- start:4677 stop:6113 length:1437 start_codon:yes stop_codon:yes gene_type:complete
MLKRNRELTFDKAQLEEQARQTNEEPWFKEDKLDRGPHVRAITHLLTDVESDFVLTLSSPWGTGKTTFMRMWKAYLEYKGYPCVMFNAWEHDYAENPFLTFIAEMSEQLTAMGGKSAELEGALTELKKIGKKLFPKMLSLGVKTTLGLSVDFEGLGEKFFGDDQEASEQAGAELTNALGGTLEAYAGEVLNQHASTKAMVKEFKEQLSRVVEKVDDGKPLFFFVDELDRCKPTYAVELLEAVKHLFEASGIIFVLSLDREQLGHSVRAAYGQGMDADGYLRRFIDLEYRIPEPEKGPFVEQLIDVYDVGECQLFQGHNQAQSIKSFQDEFVIACGTLPLRTIEKAFLRGVILLKSLTLPGEWMARSLAHLIVLKEVSSEIFDSAMEHENNWSTDSEVVPDNINLGGIESQKITILVKHRYNWIEADNHRFFDRNFAGDDVVLQQEVQCATYYYDANNSHLIDDIQKYLDLSESLVAVE